MKQRGNVYVILALVIAAAAALAGLVTVWRAYTGSLDEAGYNRGRVEAEAAYAKRDNAALQAAIAARTAAELRVLELEDKSALAVAKASTNYQKGLRDGKAELDAAVADVRAGFRLRDPAGDAGRGADCAGSPTGPAGASSGGRNGPAGSDLSEQSSIFLLSLADEADAVVKQLTACQAIVSADRARP